MFLMRTTGEPPVDPRIRVVMVRKTPSQLPNSAGKSDFFITADDETEHQLRARGLSPQSPRDGWYPGDDGLGGVTVWESGRFWELRDTPFDVKEAVGPAT